MVHIIKRKLEIFNSYGSIQMTENEWHILNDVYYKSKLSVYLIVVGIQIIYKDWIVIWMIEN